MLIIKNPKVRKMLERIQERAYEAQKAYNERIKASQQAADVAKPKPVSFKELYEKGVKVDGTEAFRYSLVKLAKNIPTLKTQISIKNDEGIMKMSYEGGEEE